MRITQLEISNFKALTWFAIENVGDAIVLAGPNGCGKSCVFDGIRLLKSAYGGYNPNEWHSWMGEFQINFQQRPEELGKLLQDPSRELRIAAEFSFAADELAYIRDHAEELVLAAVWREVVPELVGWRALGTTSFASQYRAHNPEVERRTKEGVAEVLAELDVNSFRAGIAVGTKGIGRTEVSSRVLELAFGSYEPGTIGVMDFHGSNRQYNRESVAGVNLDLGSVQEQRRQSALYNMQNKYTGLKSEMASQFVRRRLAAEAGVEPAEDDLVASLRDLFTTFFPGKSFLGPEPTTDGAVEFPVRLEDGSFHDLDDLSAGEKEVLYGYMRLRSSAPHNSVILVDEPELHLNPRLIRGLARFYYNHVVTPGGNQLWLISHSDTLLREAVNFEGFEVYHMRSGNRARANENQAQRVHAGDEVERLVIELIGDLAAYRPGAKVVLFEGGGDVEFDVRMVSQLFPEFEAAVNAIAAGSKRVLGALHEVLERVGAGTLGARFYAIRDRDSTVTDEERARLYSWGGDPGAREVAPSVALSVEAAANRIVSLASEKFVLDRLREREEAVRADLLAHLESDEWRRSFRGRDVLAAFAHRHVQGVPYEGFRDLIVARMREAGHRPTAMESVLDKILADPFP